MKVFKYNRTKALIIVQIIIALVITMFNGYTLARYITEEKKNSLYEAKRFYFDSNMLVENETDIRKAYIKEGISGIRLVLYGHPIDDNINITEVDITYDLEVFNSSNELIYSEYNNVITKDSPEKTIQFYGLDNGEYRVVATATSPYTKTLYGSFVLSGLDNNIYWWIADNAGDAVATMYISTENASGTFEISWKEGLIPNTAIKQMEDAVASLGKHNIEFNKYSEYKIEFFKDGSVLNTDFTQTKDDNTGQFWVSKVTE